MLSKEEFSALLKQKKFDEIFKHSDVIQNSEDDSLKQLLALAYSHAKDFEKSKTLFQVLAEKNNHQSDWFQLCTSATALKDFELAEKAFLKAMELSNKFEKNGIMAPQTLTYFYMCSLADAKNFEAALKKSEKMKNYYRSLFATDDKFVISRGLPPFSQFIQIMNKIFLKINDPKRADKWFEDFKQGIDADGKTKIINLRKKKAENNS